MSSSPFDLDIDRSGTSSLKYDGRQEIFGKSDIIPMWVADMDFATPRAVTEALIKRANHPIYGYTQYPGSLYDSIIQWLQRHHNWTTQLDWIVMSPGVVPSLNAAVMAYTKPGDGVIVQPPVYFPFFSAAKQTDRKLVQNPLSLEGNRYVIDFDHLEQCARNARLLLLCSPHNPVGRVWEEAELTQLLSIARKHELVIFSDEIHADLIYSGSQHISLASIAKQDEYIITAVTPSKTFNIPGLNLSSLIIPNPDARAAINTIFEQMHVSASNPFSIVAFEAAYRHGEDWLKDLLVYLNQTQNYVAEYLTQYLPEIKLIKAEGTYLLWLDCRKLGMNDTQLHQFFIEQAAIGLSPGTLFGAEEGKGFMRLNIGAPRQTVLTALEKVKYARENLQ